MSQYEIERLNGRFESPFTSGELREMARAGKLNVGDRIRRIGESSWHDAGTVPSLAPLLPDSSGEVDEASAAGTDDFAISGSHAWDSDFGATPEPESEPSLESMLNDLGEGDLVDIDASESEPEIPGGQETDDDVAESAESSSSTPAGSPAVTDTSQEEEEEEEEEEDSKPSTTGNTVPTSTPGDGGEAAPRIREFMGTTVPGTTPEETKKELNAMTGLSSRTQNALYLILGGLMARPLMTALSSLMGEDSGVGGFLEHIGNLGAIGCTGLGVIMLLSDCLTSKAEESGTEAATSMLIRVAMVFVIVIMLVVLMQLVGQVKLPNPGG